MKEFEAVAWNKGKENEADSKLWQDDWDGR